MQNLKRLTLAAALALCSTHASAENIKLGYLTDTSGPTQDISKIAYEGFTLYIDKINKSGGVDGRKFEVDVRDVGAWSISALMRAVAEGGILCFAAAAGPDRTVFFYRDYFGRLARTLVGAVAVGRVLGLATAAEGQGLTSDGIDLVGRGLPRHVLRHR